MVTALGLQKWLGPAPDPGRAHNLWIHKIAINVVLVSDVLFTSRIYRIGDANAQPLLLSSALAISVFYAGLVFLRGYLSAVITFIIIAFLIINGLYEFAKISNTSFLINPAFQYIWIPTFSLFYVAGRRGLALYTLNAMFRYAIVYVFIYVLLVILYNSGVIPRFMLKPVVASDVERGERIFNYAAATGFAWFVCLHRARVTPNLRNLIFAAVCAFAVGITLSRVYILVLLLLTFAYLGGLNMRTISATCLTVLWVPSIIYFYGMFNDRWNPFSLFAGDSSGSARATEYETARIILNQHPIFGVGIVPTARDVGMLTGNEYFAGSDLGALGVWFDFGLLGLIMFFIGSHVVCRPLRNVGGNYAWPLFLTGCLLGAYGCIAPAIFYLSGSTYFAVMLGFWLASLAGSAESSRPRQIGAPRASPII